MPSSRPTVEVFIRGPLRWVAFYVRPDGSSPARDYLLELRSRSAGKRRAADILAKLTHLGAEVSLGSYFKEWERPILQLTREPYRVMCTEVHMNGQRYLVLLNVFEKHGPNTPREEENRTRSLFREFNDQAGR